MNYIESSALLGRSSRVKVYLTRKLLWMDSGISHALMNPVLGARLSTSEADSAIAEVADYYIKRGIPAMWIVGPTSLPPDLAERLISAGFSREEPTVGMALGISSLKGVSVEGLKVVHVRTEKDLELFKQVAVGAFGFPKDAAEGYLGAIGELGLDRDDVRHYLAFLDEVPVATSSMFLTSGVAGIYNVGTIDAVRGRGVGGAVTVTPVLEAKESGYQWATLTTGVARASTFEAIGFQKYCEFGHYFLRP